MKHDAVANTSRFEDYQENVVNWGGSLYHCDNLEVSHKLAQLDLASPMDMRAPGAAAGSMRSNARWTSLAMRSASIRSSFA